jgi:hypothetical protein
MRKVLFTLILGLPFLCAACGTPPEVKKLSLAQIGYFDQAIEAVKVQSEALIVAAEKIKQQADDRIASREQENMTNLAKLATDTIPKLNEADRKTTANQMLEKVMQTNVEVANARAKLAGDLDAIKTKTQELQAYIEKMKEVQLSLDAYLQSQKAGEQFTQDVLKQPSVNSLLGSANELLPKVTGTVNTLKILLDGLATGG